MERNLCMPWTLIDFASMNWEEDCDFLRTLKEKGWTDGINDVCFLHFD